MLLELTIEDPDRDRKETVMVLDEARVVLNVVLLLTE